MNFISESKEVLDSMEEEAESEDDVTCYYCNEIIENYTDDNNLTDDCEFICDDCRSECEYCGMVASEWEVNHHHCNPNNVEEKPGYRYCPECDCLHRIKRFMDYTWADGDIATTCGGSAYDDEDVG